jgi:hypothetical protein
MKQTSNIDYSGNGSQMYMTHKYLFALNISCGKANLLIFCNNYPLHNPHDWHSFDSQLGQCTVSLYISEKSINSPHRSLFLGLTKSCMQKQKRSTLLSFCT